MNTKVNQLKGFFTVAALLLFASIHPVYAQNDRAADEAAIRDNVKQLVTGWNTKNGAAFAKPFAEDADYVIINGHYIKGREAIATAHQRIFDTIFKDTTITLNVTQVRFIRPDVAVVHASGRRDSPVKELNQSATLSFVMTKEGKTWTIAAFQNTAVATQ